VAQSTTVVRRQPSLRATIRSRHRESPWLQKDRRSFVENLINPQVHPNRGYRSLARLLQAGWIETVLTTHFDDCLHKAAILENKPHHLVKLRLPTILFSSAQLLTTRSSSYLHGSVEHYTDKNLTNEVQTLDARLAETSVIASRPTTNCRGV